MSLPYTFSLSINFSVNGDLLIDNENVYGKDIDIISLRKKIGMVFQKPNPFPKSIFENIAYGLKIHKLYGNNDELHQKVENSLKEAALWDEVKEDLNKSAFDLSGGQQQRLCIARAIVIHPEIILMDEPSASLDPISTAKIEELIRKLKERYTIVIVTHNMQQAARVSDYSSFFMQGEMIEYDVTSKIFTTPSNKLTEEYITGRFG
jgi:phosphate transport system ATP-binding protein